MLEVISMKNLIRVSKAQEANLPFAIQTFYKWRHLGKFPEIFIKFGGALFLDLDALERALEANRMKAS